MKTRAPSDRDSRRADNLAKLTVLDEAGKTIELGTLWREHTAILVFVRHFG